MPITEGGKFSPVDRIVSPGVFTRENDLSGVAQGVAEIGAVILAPFPKGPGFAPTLITNTADLEERFGVADGVYYGPYTAKEYLKEKGFVTVCRVGALTGYRQINPFVIWAQPGTWARSGSAGALNSGSSYVLYDSDNISSTFTYVSESIIALNSFSGVSFSSSKATLAEISALTGSGFSPAQTASLVTAVSNNQVVKVITNNLASLNVYPYTLDTTLSVIRNIYRLPTAVGSLSASVTINPTVSASVNLSPITNSYSTSSGEITFFAFSNVAFIAPYATGSTLTVTGSQVSPLSTLSFVSGAAFTAKFNSSNGDNNALTVNSPSGSLYNYGQTYSFTVGALTFSTVYVTSSYQGNTSYTNDAKLLQSIAESTSTTSNFSASLANSVTITNSDGNLVGTNITLVSGSIFALRSSTGCGTQVYLKGVISGSFGKITGTFTPQWSAPADPCNPTVVNYYPRVLAVLSNTQYGTLNSSFEAPGFSGSVLNQKTATTGNYSGSQNPTSLSDFQLTLAQNTSLIGYYDFSLNPADSNYITNVFGKDPTVGNQDDQVSGVKIEAAYLYKTFEDSIQKVNDELNSGSPGWKIFAGWPSSGSFSTGETLKFTDQYSTNLNAGDSQYGLTSAATPWILSQGIAPWSGTSNTGGSTTKYQLFKVHTVSDGTITNKQYKIEISNVKLSSTVAGSDWGSFTLAVRSYSDTDKKPKYLEIFQNLSLDPNSSNFVARRIGDRYNFITYAGKIIEFGTYTNLSKYVRIEMNTVPYPVSAVPYGNEAYVTPLGGTIGNYIPVIQYSKASIYGLAPGKYASGTVISDIPLGADAELTALYPTSSTNAGVKVDTEQYFAPLPFGATIGHNIAFDLESTSSNAGTGSLITGSLYGSIPSTYDATNEATYVKMRKFIVGFQGGFDGQSPAIPINVGSDIIPGNTQGLNCTNINSAGSIAYKQCVGALGNADEFDINLIVTPGIFHQHHTYVTQLVTDMCEARGDTFYIMDNVVFPSSNQTVGLIDAAVNDVSTIDSSYVATYYPWIKILDTNLNKIISVPPSVVMPSVYAANDNAAAEWFAPAGLNRGGIAQAIQVLDRTTHSERDTLYEGRVNPIAAFPGQGICVWGQKTLQIQPSALDRVNVRRLLIALKKFIASSSKFLVFEQNVAATRNRFLSIVNPYLESVQQRSGLYAFQVVMDDTNNTPDLVDRNILYGQIYLQPAKTAEFIVLDFNILPTGAVFPGA